MEDGKVPYDFLVPVDLSSWSLKYSPLIYAGPKYFKYDKPKRNFISKIFMRKRRRLLETREVRLNKKSILFQPLETIIRVSNKNRKQDTLAYDTYTRFYSLLMSILQ